MPVVIPEYGYGQGSVRSLLHATKLGTDGLPFVPIRCDANNLLIVTQGPPGAYITKDENFNLSGSYKMLQTAAALYGTQLTAVRPIVCTTTWDGIGVTSYIIGTAAVLHSVDPSGHDAIPVQHQTDGETVTALGNVLPSIAKLYGFDGTNYRRAKVDTQGNILNFPQITFALSQQLQSPGFTNLYQPSSGKKFRLMKYYIEITGTAIAATAADCMVMFYDGATLMPLFHQFAVPTSAVNPVRGNSNTGLIDLGHGVLSTAADNILRVNLDITLTGGNVIVLVMGTEE